MKTIPPGYEPILDDAGTPTGYHREVATGEVVTFDEEWEMTPEECEDDGGHVFEVDGPTPGKCIFCGHAPDPTN